MTQYVTPKEASSLLQVTAKTLREWDKQGKIGVIRTPGGTRRYCMEDIQNHIGGSITPDKGKNKVCYCRVSSTKQMDDLERQKDFFRTNFPDHQLVTDVGSGLNWKRKGLKTLLDRSMHGDISEIVVAHRDRLCRFAFELVEWIFEHNGVKLVVLSNKEDQSPNTELADDILSIVHVYSCREMGRRRYTNKKSTPLPDTEPGKDMEEVDGDQTICI